MMGAEIVGAVGGFRESGPPKLVCRRNSDPNTRRLFDSSTLRSDPLEDCVINGLGGF